MVVGIRRPRNVCALPLGSCIKLSPEKAMAPCSSTLAWKIPWTEEPGRLQSVGSLRVGQDWATSFSLFTFMHWRRKLQPHSSVLEGTEAQRVLETYGRSHCWHVEEASLSAFWSPFWSPMTSAVRSPQQMSTLASPLRNVSLRWSIKGINNGFLGRKDWERKLERKRLHKDEGKSTSMLVTHGSVEKGEFLHQ